MAKQHFPNLKNRVHTRKENHIFIFSWLTHESYQYCLVRNDVSEKRCPAQVSHSLFYFSSQIHPDKFLKLHIIPHLFLQYPFFIVADTSST